MKMRLLEKSDIEQKKAQEQAVHVQEGLKIARRVDSLREVHAAEEESLRKFRNESIAKIHEEITKETERKELLINENAKLEKERERLREPLDAEWAKLEETKRDIGRVTEAAELAKQEAFTEREKARADNREARNNRVRTDGHLREAKRLNRIASDKSAEATADEKEADRIRKTAEDAARIQSEDLQKRTEVIGYRERDLDIRDERLRNERAELDNEWIKLEDRKQMLERTINRKQK